MKPVRIPHLIMLALFALLTAAAPLRADNYTDRMQFANGLYTRKMYDLASREYASIILKFPNRPQNDAATFRLAECLRQQGRNEEASKLYSRIVVNYKKSPFRLRAAYRRARIYMDTGDFQSAIAHFNAILAEKPKSDLAAAATFYLGESLLKSNQPDKADKALAKLIKQYPKSRFVTHALLYRGEIYRDKWLATAKNKKELPAKNADAEKAFNFFNSVMQRDAGDRMSAESLFQMAEIRFRQHKYDQSTELYRKLISRYPEDERAKTAAMQAAWSANNSGMYAEALSLATKALAQENTGNKDEWLYLKANAERQLMQSREAVKSYLKLLINHPTSRFAPPARYEIAVTYFKMGKYADAVHHAEMIRITPELRSDVSWLLAESYAALGKSSEAVQYYRMVVRAAPGSDRARDALYRLAHQLQYRKSYREASQAYNKLVNQFPKSEQAPQALYASAFCLEHAKAYDEAARDWRRLAEEYPNSKLAQEAAYRKAICQIRLERRKEATASLDELLRRFPQGRFAAEAHYWKGVLLYEQKNYEQAAADLREAMRGSPRDDLRYDATFQLGLALQKMNKPGEAAVIFQQLLDSPANDKFSPSLLEWLSAYYDSMQQYPKAAKAARLLIKNSDKPAWKQSGYTLLSRALEKLGNKKDAQKACRVALSFKVTTSYAAEAALRLGELALADGKTSDAVSYFKMATTKATDENRLTVRARGFFGLGRAAEKGGNLSEASRYYMSVAILYDDPEIVPECLYRAANAYGKLRHKDDRNKAAAELKTRYPESTWAKKLEKSWLD